MAIASRRIPVTTIAIFILMSLFLSRAALSFKHLQCRSPQVIIWSSSIIKRLFCQSQVTTTSTFAQVPIIITPDVKTLNLAGLKEEITRNHLRAFKKCVKATERYQKAMKEYDEIVVMDNPPLEVLEKCPNIDELRLEMEALKKRLASLAELEETLKTIKTTSDPQYESNARKALELGVTDTPPPRQDQRPKKSKGPRTMAPRKPYNVYRSVDGIEIRVGRSSSDNDELSCNPEHRDPKDWWMHVSGSPGSHVVIRCDDDKLPTKFSETVDDAALLAAVYSKGNNNGKVTVSLCRCRDIFKPAGFKPGMVRLNGEVRAVIIDTKLEKKRLERLESTKNAGIVEEN
jgi:predicted ribosome quality control (RQC) complex YloA/Tae2 family protein